MEMIYLRLNVTYLDIIKPHNVFMLQLLYQKKETNGSTS